jgi:hypothetical protein
MRRVDVVPHTHWDREWYEPYPTFRLRLLDLLDELLPRLESDPRFRHFQLDGQMAVVDDYLGLRPWEEQRLRTLAAEGRVSMGPWYVLPDEFLVSGETHVRNLQRGMARAAHFGGAMEVGYLPDMFGHVAQMPQLLAQFGFGDAVVWRGVPSSITTPAFWWEAPDGTRVRAAYLPAGYGNGSDLSADPDRVVDQVDLFVQLQGTMVGDPVLVMAGMDHEVPPAHLTDVLDAVNGAAADRDAQGRPAYQLHITSLAEHLGRTPTEDLPVHRGELRSGARANLLMGVASNRVDVKVAAAVAERTLERLAEPLATLWLDDHRRWRPVLEAAWLEVIRNAAHDSICACSHDEVVEAVLHRYHEATRLAGGIADRAVAAAGRRMAAPGTVVVNPGARDRGGVVRLDVPAGVGDDRSVQVLVDHPEREELAALPAPDAPMAYAVTVLGEHREVHHARFADVDGPDGPELVVHLLPTPGSGDPGPGAGPVLGAHDALAELGRWAGEHPDRTVRLVLWRDEPYRTALALTGDVPRFGWRRWTPTAPRHPVAAHGDLGLANGLVTVDVDATTGGWTLDGLPGPVRLVDGGDVGDTYNWCPPDSDRLVDAPAAVEVERTEAGPVRGRVVVRATYRWPERAEPDEDPVGAAAVVPPTWRSAEEVAVVVTTTLELRADEPFVRVGVELDNRARDHRLRLHLPLPRRATTSEAECAYTVVQRPLWAEGGPNEWGVPTFPSRRFVRAGGLTVTHDGLCEYELVDLDGGAADPETTAGELAITLVRSTGWLSRPPMASRPTPAGPYHRLEGAQLQAPLSLRLAVHPESAGDLDPHELAERCWVDLPSVVAPGGGDLGDAGSLLPVGAEGLEVDAIHVGPDGATVLRAHEPWGAERVLDLEGRSGALVDLAGREVEPVRDRVGVGPHRIITVRLDRTGEDRP